ncbi:hypothetical protein QWY85_04690 [Neolewinella lacunae]|uniref:Uncharacterized protein n=1 Tax=Neolewinella lacunae TaxID=1517758 RepID=A0A923PL59_9BACT|nr:hypothetical protein [Neolewinella lacunae]MBC6996092.1 hypothetical protein [Neolewinella lacunae]MDN3633945.1 hypothetical protein [Neolewinella lacunae]
MVSKYDHLLVGLLTSVVISFIAYALLIQGVEWASGLAERNIVFQPRTVALMAICLNVLPMNYFRRRYHNRSLRGLVIGTMLMATLWFVYYGRDLLNGG